MAMTPHAVYRAAVLMIDKYNDQALQKCVAAAMYYTEKDDHKGSARWIKIGHKVKELLKQQREGQSA